MAAARNRSKRMFIDPAQADCSHVEKRRRGRCGCSPQGRGTRYGMPKVLAENGEWLRACVTALADGGCDDIGRGVGCCHGRRACARAGGHRRGLGARTQRVGACGCHGHRRRVRRAAYGRHTRHRRRRGGAGYSTPRARRRRGWRVPATVTGPGHPVVIARAHWPQLLDGLAGDEGARPFLRHRTDVVAVECGDLASGDDIDAVTP